MVKRISTVSSVFSQIMAGEIPSHRVYEDEYAYAFMDIHPIQPGHVLVVSRREVENFYELDGAEYDGLMHAVRIVARRIEREFPAKRRVAVIIEGLDVPHVHVKVFPIDTGEELRHIPDMSAEPDHEALHALAERLAKE
jgi:histidine triad (HIT) family protein